MMRRKPQLLSAESPTRVGIEESGKPPVLLTLLTGAELLSHLGPTNMESPRSYSHAGTESVALGAPLDNVTRAIGLEFHMDFRVTEQRVSCPVPLYGSGYVWRLEKPGRWRESKRGCTGWGRNCDGGPGQERQKCIGGQSA
jgi:hypothetical protein